MTHFSRPPSLKSGSRSRRERISAVRPLATLTGRDDQRFQRDLAISYEREALALEELAEYEAALESYRRTFEIRERAVEADPENAYALSDSGD